MSPPWSGVYESLQNGNLGIPPTSPVGTILAVGPCSLVNTNDVLLYSKADVKAVRAELGYGDLPERLHDFFALAGNKAKAIVVPAVKDVAGSFGDLLQSGDGTAVAEVSGSPTGLFQVLVEIVTGGAAEEATYRYSYDDGANWSSPIATPALGVAVDIGPTGAKLTWADTYPSEASFVAGDEYAFVCSPPSCSLSSLLDALSAGAETKLPFEYACVFTGTGYATWTGLEAWGDDLFAAHRQVRILTEVPIADAEVPEAQIAMMNSYNKGDRVSITAGFGPVLDMYGKQMTRGISGLVAGLIAARPVQRSIGEAAYCQMSPLLGLHKGFTDAILQALNGLRYIVPRQYEGKSGFYVNNGNVACQDTSDYQDIETVRVFDNVIRAVRLTALNFVHSTVNSVDGVADPAGLKGLEGACQGTLGGLSATFSSARITIPEGQDVLTRQGIDATISIIKKGYLKEINLAFGLVKF